MELGYILAIVFAVIWLGFKVFEMARKNNAKGKVNLYEKESYEIGE